MKKNELKKIALVGLAPFMMTGCTQMGNVAEQEQSTESVAQSYCDIEASVRQTDDGIKIECNNPIVENILKTVLPYDLSKLNIETLSIIQYDKSSKECHIKIHGKEKTTYKYCAEGLLDAIIQELVSNNICADDKISLSLYDFEFDHKTHFPNKLCSFYATNCSGLLSEKEIKNDSHCWFDDCDIFVLDKNYSYPKIESICYDPFFKELNFDSEPYYFQQSLEYFVSEFDVKTVTISPSWNHNQIDPYYSIDLSSISFPVQLHLSSYTPSTFEIKNASDISFDLCVNDGKYDKEKSQFFNSLAKEQLEINGRVDVAVSNVGEGPVVSIGPSKMKRK